MNIKDYMKQYQLKNKDHLNDQKKNYIKNHKEQRKQTTKRYRKRTKTEKQHLIKQLVRTAKTNAKKKKLEFEITYDLIESLINNQNNKCSVTGKDFDYSHREYFRSRPYTPSIDRKDCRKGYILENIQIVTCMVNRAKNEFSQEMFDEMCKLRMEKIHGS